MNITFTGPQCSGKTTLLKRMKSERGLMDMGKMRIKLSKKEIKKLEKQGRLRDSVEIWVDRHNHKLELLRTFSSLTAAICSSIVLLKLFGLIH